MKFPFDPLDYKLDSQTGVWSRSGYRGIAYSDGNEVEQRIAAIVEQAHALTVLSAELSRQCTDWPSLYHLSGTRANILRPFHDILKGADVLEVGAGCGAITRYLGECEASVVALEGSPRRAAITRLRTRDLPNVLVVSDRLDDFTWDQRFDVITLIGVLEYANLFVSGSNPALALLEQAKARLKPNGTLIIAIENQLGLKYFAGAPEDHLGQPMYGIEGRYRKDQPQTYGRKTLSDLLRQAGFSRSEFMAPFPDYKLPVSIVTETGFSCEGFDAAALAWQSAKRDPQLPNVLAISPELVWPILAQNRLALDLANSFLVVAGALSGQKPDLSVLAWHFTGERSGPYCKETRFSLTDRGSVEVRCHPLAPGSPKHARGRLVTFAMPEKAEYAQGSLLSQELIRIVTRDGWLMEEVGSFLKTYLRFLGSLDASGDTPLSIDSAESSISGRYLDLIPQNIVVGPDGAWRAIDQEWTWNENIPAGWLIFRSLHALIQTVTRFGQPAGAFANTPIGFIHAAFKAMEFSVTESEIEAYAALEAELQAEVSRRPLKNADFLHWLHSTPLPLQNLTRALADRDIQIARLTDELVRWGERGARLDKIIAERDGLIGSLNQALADRDRQFTRIFESFSWRATKPFRLLRRIRNTSVSILSQAFNNFLKHPSLFPFKEIREYLSLRNNSLFDRVFYSRCNDDLSASGLDPAWHYVLYGAKEGRKPNPLFDSAWYLSQYPDVAAAGINPLAHYLSAGASEGRKPNPLFDSAWYLSQYPDVAAAGINPLAHYLSAGASEGRKPGPLS